MKSLRAEHLLFGLTLATLAALSAWWTVFFLRSVEAEGRAAQAELLYAVEVGALLLGQEEEKPAAGPWSGHALLEMVVADGQPQEMMAPLFPRHPDRGIRPRPEALRQIEQRVFRRKAMVAGEGGLLLVLLVGLSYQLYRLVRREKEHMSRMEFFVASVSHEMKTPLTGIKSLLQTFAAGRVPEEERARLCALGLKESERLEHTIENLVVSGRLRRGAVEVRCEAVELNKFLESFLDHRRRYLIDRPESLRMEWEAPSPLSARADPQALRTVLENLVDNAFKYGGTEVVIRVKVAEQIEIRVEDNGQGFEPEKAEELFLPFRRVYRAGGTTRHGTGLGLSISRELVRQMGGELRAESPGRGQGSRFILILGAM